MQKLFLPPLFVILLITHSNAQQRLFDQPMQLKTCNISIEANSFIATTVIEMEFYNSKDQEVEGYQYFELNRGQVITDFQLELNGKYREGSIEERRKARQAYSRIVGKRIDPAILQMNGRDKYSINIYPIAAKSSRKIKFTITQMMVEENLKLSYTLPLNFTSTTENFNLDIKMTNPASIPYANKGLLENQLFSMASDEGSLFVRNNNVVLNQPVSFSINQFFNKPQFCINKKNGKTNFLMRYFPDAERYYACKPKSINVYWDVSLSGNERNLVKELDFLEKYISLNEINKTTIFLFNHQVQGVIVFNRLKDNFNSIRNYLLTYKYTGATELGNLNFSNVLADAVLLFSDGINSIGNAQPKLGSVKVNLVTSTYNYNYDYFKNIVGNTGGSVIRLYNAEVKSAVKKIDTAENFLLKYTASNIHINEQFPLKLGGSIMLSGTIYQADNLELFYGNNTAMAKSENYYLPSDANCDETTYRKLQMLKTYDSLVYGNQDYYYYGNWQQMVVFGLTEKVVTPQTSYLVLERIEDYINYKIAPPKDLEEKCAELNYVYKSEYKIKALKEFTEQETLESVVKEYNKYVNWWSKDEALIDLKKIMPVEKAIDVATTSTTDQNKPIPATTGLQNSFAGVKGELKEVVVTSAFGTKRSARSTTSNAQNISYEQLNVIRQTNINDALAGKVAGLQVRSQSYAKLGAETIVRLRGENGIGIGGGALYVVNGTIMPSAADINPDDVEDITVLQGPAAAALFGPDGANGAIVVNLKKGRRNYSYYTWDEYRLSSTEDEDYLVQMKNAAKYEFWDVYLKLENQYRMDIGFYFEMANFFFETYKPDKAQDLMYNAIELCRGCSEGLKLAAYMYEKWKWFDKAIAVYKGILNREPNNLAVRRDLALAYFQHNDFEAAVKTYYAVITWADEADITTAVKNSALSEMNAILALHKNEFDISYINQNMVKLLPVDLRITVESNYNYTNATQFIEPGDIKCNSVNPHTINGGKYNGSDYYKNYRYIYDLSEYTIKNAPAGRYKIKVNAYNLNSYESTIPMYIRVISFKNFQKENMEMEIKIFDLDNQYGVIELDDVKW